MPRHTGQGWFIEQPQRVHYDVINGNTWERSWKGRYEALQFGLPLFRRGALTTDYSQEGAVGTVTSRYGNLPQDGQTEQPVTIFDLRVEEIAQSIWKSPAFSGLGNAVIRAIEIESETVTTADNYKTAYDQAVARIQAVATAEGKDPAVALQGFSHLLQGNDQYLVSQSYSLTRVLTVSRIYSLTYTYAQDGLIFSTAALSAYVGNTLPWAIPPLSAADAAGELFLVYGWRKRGTETTNLPNGNVQITEIWQSGRWSLNLYGVFA